MPDKKEVVERINKINYRKSLVWVDCDHFIDQIDTVWLYIRWNSKNTFLDLEKKLKQKI